MNKNGGIRLQPHKQASGVSPNRDALKKSTLFEKARLSFELYDDQRQCASSWQSDEIKLLFDSFRKLSERTWEQIFKSGGKGGNKVGLGYTPFENDNSCPIKRPAALTGEDVRMSEIRVSQQARIFGAHIAGVYFVVELDKGHKKA